jgi:hypothetical protein
VGNEKIGRIGKESNVRIWFRTVAIENRSVKQKKEELSEFRFEPSAEEKITRIPFCGTKIEGTLGIPSEPLHGRLSLA